MLTGATAGDENKRSLSVKMGKVGCDAKAPDLYISKFWWPFFFPDLVIIPKVSVGPENSWDVEANLWMQIYMMGSANSGAEAEIVSLGSCILTYRMKNGIYVE